ncbi:MAG: hypothetical protein ACRDRN_12530 [Sciscionella sp.]
MISRTTSRTLAVLAAALAAVLVAGCGAGPSQVGAAAIVGDTVISLDQVQQQIDSVLRKEPAAKQAQQQRKFDLVSRQIVSLKVRHELLKQVAAAQHLRGDPAKAAATLQAAGGARKASKGTVYGPAGITQQLNDQQLLTELARKQLPGLAVTFDFIVADGPSQAKDLAHRLAADPGSAAAMVRHAVTSGGSGGVGRRAVAAQDPQDAAGTPLFGLPAGSVAAFGLGGSNARWLVVLVHKRETAATPANNSAVQQLDDQTLQQIGLHLLEPYVLGKGIKINPRYGVWDSLGMEVSPSQAEASGVLLTARGGAKQ